MTKTQVAETIFKEAEKEHLNLFHHITKEEFEIKKRELLKNADKMTDIQFDAALLKLFAIIKNDHCSYFHKTDYLSFAKWQLLDGKAYIPINKNDYAEVVKINGFDIKTVMKKFSELINYETNGWLLNKLEQSLFDLNMHKMLGIANEQDAEITFEVLKNGEREKICFKKAEMVKFDFPKEPIYNFEIKDKILYVKYRLCSEEKNCPFIQFIEDIKNRVEKQDIKGAILDVRGNSGGDSEILNPFQNYLKELKCPVAVLLDRGTFSSGRTAVARFKKEFNAALIGEPAGGAVKSYGYYKPMNVEGYKFSVAIRLWDFSSVFGCQSEIKPDIAVSPTINDVRAGRDTVLEKAHNFMLSKLNKTFNNDETLNFKRI